MLVGSKIKNIFIRVYWNKKIFKLGQTKTTLHVCGQSTETCVYYKQYVIKNKVFLEMLTK